MPTKRVRRLLANNSFASNANQKSKRAARNSLASNACKMTGKLERKTKGKKVGEGQVGEGKRLSRTKLIPKQGRRRVKAICWKGKQILYASKSNIVLEPRCGIKVDKFKDRGREGGRHTERDRARIDPWKREGVQDSQCSFKRHNLTHRNHHQEQRSDSKHEGAQGSRVAEGTLTARSCHTRLGTVGQSPRYSLSLGSYYLFFSLSPLFPLLPSLEARCWGPPPSWPRAPLDVLWTQDSALPFAPPQGKPRESSRQPFFRILYDFSIFEFGFVTWAFLESFGSRRERIKAQHLPRRSSRVTYVLVLQRIYWKSD